MNYKGRYEQTRRRVRRRYVHNFVRSVNNMVIVPASTEGDRRSSRAVIATDHTNSGTVQESCFLVLC